MEERSKGTPECYALTSRKTAWATKCATPRSKSTVMETVTRPRTGRGLSGASTSHSSRYGSSGAVSSAVPATSAQRGRTGSARARTPAASPRPGARRGGAAPARAGSSRARRPPRACGTTAGAHRERRGELAVRGPGRGGAARVEQCERHGRASRSVAQPAAVRRPRPTSPARA